MCFMTYYDASNVITIENPPKLENKTNIRRTGEYTPKQLPNQKICPKHPRNSKSGTHAELVKITQKPELYERVIFSTALQCSSM